MGLFRSWTIFFGASAAILGMGLCTRLRPRPTGPEVPPVRADQYGRDLPPFARARIGRRPARLAAHPMVFTADGSQVVTHAGNGLLVTLAFPSAEVVEEFEFHEVGASNAYVRSERLVDGLFEEPQSSSPLNAVALSRHAGYVGAIAGGEVVVWDRVNKTRQGGANGLAWNSRTLAVSPDGATIAMAQNNVRFSGKNQRGGNIYLANPGAGGRISGTVGVANCTELAFSPDGSRIAANGMQLVVAGVPGGKAAATTETRPVLSTGLAFSGDGSRVVTFERNEQQASSFLVLREASGGKEVWRHELSEHPKSSIAYAGDTIAFPGKGKLHVHYARTGALLRTLDVECTPAAGVAVSPDGAHVAVSDHGRMRGFRVSDWAEVTPAPPAPVGPFGGVRAFDFSPDGRLIATTSRNGPVALWSTADGSFVRELSNVTGAGVHVAFDASGKEVAVYFADGTVALWNVADGAVANRWTLEEKATPACALGFVGGRLTILHQGGKGIADLIDVAAGKKRTLGTRVRSAAFLPEGRLVATVDGAWRPVVYDLETLEAERPIPSNQTIAAQPSRTGTHLAVMGGTTLRVFDLRSRARRFQIRIWGGGAYANFTLAVSPDGRYAAFSANNRVVELWSIPDGKRLRRFDGHLWPVTSLRFSPDGHTLASAAKDENVLLWDLRPWTDP